MKIRILTLFTLTFCFVSCFGQFFDESQTPLSVKWRQIDHAGFRVIYPQPLEKEAQRMVNTFAHLYPIIGRSLKQFNTAAPIILQNQGTTSNGFVQLAPKKAQLYTMPPQDFDSQDWLNNLAVHELRHLAQFNKITNHQGFPFPEEIHFGYIGAAMPLWFLEGDAVSTETALTYSGRGRQPSWIMPFRTALLSGKKPSYSKAYFGSEKDVGIGYYQLGYLVNSQLQKEFGTEIGNLLLTDIQKRPLRLYPFSNSLKKFTGKSTKKYYLQTVKNLTVDWEKQLAKTNYVAYPSLNKTNSYETNYYLPVKLPSKEILTLKQSKSETPGLVAISPTKAERKLFKIGYQEQPWYSYGNGKIVWDERREDPRYKQRSYNVICLYDLQTKKRRQLTQRSRLFSPSLSNDGKTLIAVKIDMSNHSTLVWLNLETGQILDSIANPTNDHLQMPSLNHDGNKITWISVSEAGKSLWLREHGENKLLIENSRQQLNKPVFMNDQIAFNGHFSGVDNIYSISPETKKISALTAAKFGAFNAGIVHNDSTILFNNYQPTGYEIAKITINPQPIEEHNFVYYGQNTTHDDYVFANVPDSIFLSKPYHPLKNLFNLHSISPTLDDAENFGIQLKSDDLLNTTRFSAGVIYESSLKQFSYNAGITYKALYPVFDVSYTNRPRLVNYRFKNAMQQAAWREDVTSLNISLPLSFSSYNHRFHFSTKAGTYYINRHLNALDATRIVNTIDFTMSYRFSFNHQVRSAERDIAPKWSQIVALLYQHRPFEKNLTGKLWALQSFFYFPGLRNNHTFLASFNYQENAGTFKTVNDIPTVYGYNQIKAKEMLSNTLLLNYRFPFLYPDLEIGALAYIRNLRATLFNHYENIGHETNVLQPKTFGLELRSDMNLLRYQPVADVGIRFIFVNKIYKQNPILELLFNYNF